MLFATDQPWGDFGGEYHRMIEATGGDSELAGMIFHDNYDRSTAEPGARRTPAPTGVRRPCAPSGG